MEEDFYQVLRVPRLASRSEISKAYRHLALRYHPDKTADPSALSHFLRISEAYNTLKNDNSRSKYDFETAFTSLFQLFRSQPVTVNRGCGRSVFSAPLEEVDDMDSFASAFSEAQHCKICFFPLPASRHRLHFLTEHFAEFSRWKGRRTVPPEKKRKT